MQIFSEINLTKFSVRQWLLSQNIRASLCELFMPPNRVAFVAYTALHDPRALVRELAVSRLAALCSIVIVEAEALAARVLCRWW